MPVAFASIKAGNKSISVVVKLTAWSTELIFLYMHALHAHLALALQLELNLPKIQTAQAPIARELPRSLVFSVHDC